VNDPLRVGLVGTGKTAINHAAALRSIPAVELAGVTDLDPDRAEAFATRFGVDAAGQAASVIEYPEGTPGRNDVWTVKGEEAYEHALSTTVDARNALAMVLAIYESSRTGEVVDVT
jgi:Oxidoreductase family, NAD-binding Rossmann fold